MPCAFLLFREYQICKYSKEISNKIFIQSTEFYLCFRLNHFYSFDQFRCMQKEKQQISVDSSLCDAIWWFKWTVNKNETFSKLMLF